MAISHYIKEIGRGKEGARALTREQSSDLMGQILDGLVSDLELGAFCMAMRIKGETPAELLGFLESIQERINPVTVDPLNLGPLNNKPVIVIPSYNGARRLPLLTPLLAGLLNQAGFPVLIHGHASEDQRLSCESVIKALGWPMLEATSTSLAQPVAFIHTRLLCSGLSRLLDVRRHIGLRNSAHSLAKLINPMAEPHKAILLTNFTHPEYEISMTESLQNAKANALLLRGTEGEAVADARRTPKMVGFVKGVPHVLHEQSLGSLESVPSFPTTLDAASTAHYIQEVLAGNISCPEPIARQVQAVQRLSTLVSSGAL